MAIKPMADTAFHPGEFIREEIDERGMSQRKLARLMGRPYQTVNEIVNADGILAESGLEVYDIILEINGEKVDTRTALRDAVAALKKDEDLKLTILRDGKKETLKVKR